MTTTSETARMLARALEYSGLTQREVAIQVGFPKPNMISMMKKGESRVPIDRIPALARACGVDAVLFIETAMREYQPEAWRAITGAFGKPLNRDQATILRAHATAVETEDEELDLSPSMELVLVEMFSRILEMKKAKAGLPPR